MKKFYLLIFLVLFSGLLFLTRQSLINEYNYYQIKKSPAQTTAIKREYITSGKGDFQGFWAKFFYEVDGKQFDFTSLDTSKKIAYAYVNEEKYKQITYAKHAPSKAMLTYHYNLWNEDKTSGGMAFIILISMAFVSMLLTLLIALVVGFFKKLSA